MRQGSSRDTRKDLILRPILESHHACPDARWVEILLLIFWPGLHSIIGKMRGRDPDLDALWTNVEWAFTRVIYGLDPAQRASGLAQKIYNDTAHYIRKEYAVQEQRWKCQVSTESPEVDKLLAGDDPGIADFELRDERDGQSRWLYERCHKGVISEEDRDLIDWTIVYGEPLADYCRRAGITYEVAKKRRQRALRKLREHEKKHKYRKFHVPE